MVSSQYPKSKKLNIKFDEIYLSENEISENEEIRINGQWNLMVDIPKEMYERETIVYNVKSCSDRDIKITEAVLYNTGMKFEFTTNVQPIYEESDSSKVKDRKIDELAEWYKNQRLKFDKSYINNEILVSSNGKKYLPVESSSEDAGTEYLVDGTFRHWQTFTLTKYEMTDTMKIYFNINIPSGSKDVIIELERK